MPTVKWPISVIGKLADNRSSFHSAFHILHFTNSHIKQCFLPVPILNSTPKDYAGGPNVRKTNLIMEGRKRQITLCHQWFDQSTQAGVFSGIVCPAPPLFRVESLHLPKMGP